MTSVTGGLAQRYRRQPIMETGVDHLFPSSAYHWNTRAYSEPDQALFVHPPEPQHIPHNPLQTHPPVPHPPDDEPLYVNAKQYYRILKRRVARARLEELHRLSRQRKVFPFFPPLLFSSPLQSRTSTSPAISMLCAALVVQAADS